MNEKEAHGVVLGLGLIVGDKLQEIRDMTVEEEVYIRVLKFLLSHMQDAPGRVKVAFVDGVVETVSRL